MSDMKVAIIGLDTSHSVAMPKLMNDPACEPDMKVSGLKAVTCLRFETPFQGKEGLDNRQAQLEGWGVKVTLDFDEAIADCDAIMMEINDPAYHLDYFKRLANLGKPIFLDKPMAANVAESREIAMLSCTVHRIETRRHLIDVLQADGFEKDTRPTGFETPSHHLIVGANRRRGQKEGILARYAAEVNAERRQRALLRR